MSGVMQAGVLCHKGSGVMSRGLGQIRGILKEPF